MRPTPEQQEENIRKRLLEITDIALKDNSVAILEKIVAVFQSRIRYQQSLDACKDIV